MKRLSDVEIIDIYEEATDKDAVIDKLAVRCRMDRTGMRQKLRELGLSVKEPPPLDAASAVRKLRSDQKIDEAKARELFRAGKSDAEMAAAFHCAEITVRSWRLRNGLKRKKGGDMRKKNKEDAQMGKRKKTEEDREQEILESIDAGKKPEAKSEDLWPDGEPAPVAPTRCQPGKAVDVWADPKPAEPRPAANIRMETPVRVADIPEGMTVGSLAALFNNLCGTCSRIVRVTAGHQPVRGVVVTLRYDDTCKKGPESMVVDLET